MKIAKINVSGKNSVYSAIKNSMKNSKELVCNLLDACGCTGNGLC